MIAASTHAACFSVKQRTCSYALFVVNLGTIMQGKLGNILIIYLCFLVFKGSSEMRG